jgi:hypothetical protein
MLASLAPALFVSLVGADVGTLEDFDAFAVGPFQKGYLETWRWTDVERARLREASRIEIVADAVGAGRLLRVVVQDRQVLAREALAVCRLAKHLPPEADALRLRIRVVRGQVRLYAGGPTAYYANSDVFTGIRTVTAAAEPEWTDVELSLNHPLWRNFRRAGVSTDAPRNYYTRWAQEPLGLFVAAGTDGEFLLDRIDVVNRGEGRPFPEFAPGDVEHLRTIADFEDGRRDDAFTWYMANSETEWFAESWTRSKPLRFTPAKLTVIDDGANGAKSLASTGPTTEEVHGVGVRTTGEAAANALRVTAYVEAPGERNALVGVGPAAPLDFFVLTTSAPKDFDWKRFGPSDELRKHPGPGFDYDFSYRSLRGRDDVGFAIYQARRFVRPQTWATLVVPAADFTCIYGHGADRRRLVNHEPLDLGEVAAVGWLNPWCRVGNRSGSASIRIDDLALVRVPGTPAEHRSFWQLPEPGVVRIVNQPGPYGGLRRMLWPGDDDGLTGP